MMVWNYTIRMMSEIKMGATMIGKIENGIGAQSFNTCTQKIFDDPLQWKQVTIYVTNSVLNFLCYFRFIDFKI